MTKLHLILVFTVIAVAMYMYFLYKEIKVFQSEVQEIKSQVQKIMSGQDQQPAVCQIVPMPPKPDAEVVPAAPPSVSAASADDQDPINNDEDVVFENQDDDDMSVSSNEIKEILTNIQDVDNDGEQQPGAVQAETTTVPDMAGMSTEELSCFSYEELRSYLRKHGVNVKGKKADLIIKVQTLHSG